MDRFVLVTGGAGYIGSHACKALAQAGFTPVVADNMSSGHRWAVKWGPFEQMDLRDRAGLHSLFKRYPIEAVMHFAAFSRVGESIENPRTYFDNNIVSSLILLDAMKEANVGVIVFSSTCATYGIPKTLPISEDHIQQPINPYGESKLFIERALHWCGQAEGLMWAALRYFNAAGADPECEIGEDHDLETRLIPLVLHAALEQHPALEIFGTDYPTPDGTAIRDYIHVTDLADAHITAINYLQTGGTSGAFNLGTGRGYSVREVVETVQRVTGLKVPTRNAPRRPGDASALYAQPDRANEILGWKPRCSDLESIVETAFAWHKKRYQRAAAVSMPLDKD